MGYVAGLGDKLNGTVPHCQVRHNARVAGMPMPQKRVVVDSYVSSNVYAGVESTRAVKADCDVRKDIDRDIDVIQFLVPEDGVIQDLLGLVLHNRCEVEHLG